jgi:hypothetical protein
VAVERWPSYAEQAQLPEQRMQEVGHLLNRRGPRPKAEIKISVAPPPTIGVGLDIGSIISIFFEIWKK